MNDALEQYGSLLRERLTEARYYHSICVAEAAEKLAIQYHANPQKAYLAGLLHDICKDEPKDLQLQRMLDSAILLDNKVLALPALWHAETGSLYLRDELKITDTDILDAVRYHTSARAGMGLLEQIVFLADLISADRNYADVAQMRVLVEQHSMREAMLYALQYIIGDLVSRNKQLVFDTVEAYNEYVMDTP